MKEKAILFILDQLRMHNENATLSMPNNRYEIFIEDKDIKIKVKFSKLSRRSRTLDYSWEFRHIIHKSRLYPSNIFDYYMLVGFDKNLCVKKVWKVPVDSNIIYRTSQIYIPVGSGNKYSKYEYTIIDSSNGSKEDIC